jgi:hypothetical protein
VLAGKPRGERTERILHGECRQHFHVGSRSGRDRHDAGQDNRHQAKHDHFL